MRETQKILLDMAAKVFSEQFSEKDLRAASQGEWLGPKWGVLEELGLPLALVGEEAGGFDLKVEEALELVRLVARHAIPLPLAETMFANHLCAISGLDVAAGPLSIAPTLPLERISLRRDGGRWIIEGIARAVPWGRQATAIAVVASDGAQDFVARVPRDGWTVASEARTIGGLPCDCLRFDASLSDDDVRPLPACLPADVILAGGAALRAIGIAGMLQEVLELTVKYVSDRSQFGRPLGKFQAVQHDIARIAEQAVAAAAAGDLAAEAFANAFGAPQIAAAKARAGEAVGIAAGLSHQLHGAIGVTEEYRLHFLTRQLWSWRDEFGSEAYWQTRLGHHALQAGGPGLWPLLTAV